MGGSSSKKVADTAVEPETVMNRSSGFHILELHLPSFGSGGMGMIVCLLVFLSCYFLYKKYNQPSHLNTFPGRVTFHRSPAHHDLFGIGEFQHPRGRIFDLEGQPQDEPRSTRGAVRARAYSPPRITEASPDTEPNTPAHSPTVGRDPILASC